MLLLLHALIPCLGAYNILPSSSVLLHINIAPSFPVLLHIYTEAENLGGQGGLEPPYFLIRGG